MAVSPAVQLAPEKQRRLCLVDAHVTCATYVAAQATHSTTERRPGHSRPVARTTPLILDQGRFDLHMPAPNIGRASGQAFLVALLGLAFVAILLARPSGDGAGAGAVAGVQATTRASAAVQTEAPVTRETALPAASAVAAAATDAPTVTAEPSAASSAPSASAAQSPGATTQPAASGATYKVKKGDTLSRIAGRFATTSQVLIRLNGIADPSKLKIGQVIKLP